MNIKKSLIGAFGVVAVFYAGTASAEPIVAKSYGSKSQVIVESFSAKLDFSKCELLGDKLYRDGHLGILCNLEVELPGRVLSIIDSNFSLEHLYPTNLVKGKRDNAYTLNHTMYSRNEKMILHVRILIASPATNAWVENKDISLDKFKNLVSTFRKQGADIPEVINVTVKSIQEIK